MNMRDRALHILRSLARNKWAKIIALILAVIVWYAIQPSISFETVSGDVPVRVLVDPGWAVLEQSSGTVDVHFRGSREGIRYLSHEQVEIVVDIRGMAYEESITVPLDVRDVRAPTAVRPVFIRPSELTLSVDQEVDREVPVRVHIQGNPPEGYEVESVKTTPSVVIVSGPRQRLEAIEAIRTTPIDMEGRLQSFKLRVGLVPPSRTWTARMDPERVDVGITLVERSAAVALEEMRIKALFGARIWREVVLRPTHADVELVGRAELLEALTARDVQVYVDLAGLEPGVEHEVPVRVHVPPRVRLERVVPATVQVRVDNDMTAAPGNAAETGKP